jgi:hypothetical protein
MSGRDAEAVSALEAIRVRASYDEKLAAEVKKRKGAEERERETNRLRLEAVGKAIGEKAGREAAERAHESERKARLEAEKRCTELVAELAKYRDQRAPEFKGCTLTVTSRDRDGFTKTLDVTSKK